MADNKNTFLLYTDIHHTVKKLSDVQAGQLFKHILGYVNDENPELKDFILEIAFEPIKQNLKRHLRKYEEIREKYSKAGKASAAKRKQAQVSAEHPETPEKAIKTLPEAPSTPDAAKIPKGTSRKPVILKPPTIEEVGKYFTEHEFPLSLAKRAWEGYQENNWIDSQGNEIKNWKLKMVQVWFKDEHKIKTGIVEHGQHPGQIMVTGNVKTF